VSHSKHAPKRFVAVMQVHGLTASSAIRGLRLLGIKPMPTPELLSRSCQICVIRKLAEPRPSTWFYRPLIEGENRITACDHHTATAVRAYCMGKDHCPA
jgi:hypothetical protein